MPDYRSLEVWKQAFQLCKETYQITKSFPREERYALIDQMRRSSVSIPSNIAEGKGRMNDRELRQFCRIAYGSAMELQTQFLLSKELNYGTTQDIDRALTKLDSVLRLLNRFISHLSEKLKAVSC